MDARAEPLRAAEQLHVHRQALGRLEIDRDRGRDAVARPDEKLRVGRIGRLGMAAAGAPARPCSFDLHDQTVRCGPAVPRC